MLKLQTVDWGPTQRAGIQLVHTMRTGDVYCVHSIYTGSVQCILVILFVCLLVCLLTRVLKNHIKGKVQLVQTQSPVATYKPSIALEEH